MHVTATNCLSPRFAKLAEFATDPHEANRAVSERFSTGRSQASRSVVETVRSLQGSTPSANPNKNSKTTGWCGAVVVVAVV